MKMAVFDLTKNLQINPETQIQRIANQIRLKEKD